MGKSECRIKSMTGFGKSVYESEGRKITVEVKSLNSKQLDISARLYNSYRSKEMEIRTMLSEKLERGKIDINVNIENTGSSSNYSLNKELAKRYYEELKSFSEDLKLSEPDYLQMIMRMPDVMNTSSEEMNEKEWMNLKNAIDEAIAQVDDFRSIEGKMLEKDFMMRIDMILKLMNGIENLDRQRIENIKKRIRKGINELLTEVKIDENRFEQELIYYLEKLDITEELIRLKKHCDYFLETMKEESAGKKLGFIGQEMGREINTLGSKANDAGMQKLVVQLKDELEKIKEQLMNIL